MTHSTTGEERIQRKERARCGKRILWCYLGMGSCERAYSSAVESCLTCGQLQAGWLSRLISEWAITCPFSCTYTSVPLDFQAFDRWKTWRNSGQMATVRPKQFCCTRDINLNPPNAHHVCMCCSTHLDSCDASHLCFVSFTDVARGSGSSLGEWKY